jgi:hypothetical protein
VRAVLRQRVDEVFRSRTSSLAPWLPHLEVMWDAGCRNAAELWRRLRGEALLRDVMLPVRSRLPGPWRQAN